MSRSDVWMPQPGSQLAFLTCPYWEVLYEGTRGPGKTDALLMDYAQHVGQGYGPAWRGILFRESYPQLADVIARTKKWFARIFPTAKYNHTYNKWVFEDGEELLFRHMRVESEYWNYHGHEYPWVGWEELTNWADGDCYESMKTCNRSSHKGIPIKYRSNANPWGVGHSYWKRYWIDPAPANTKIYNDAGQIRMRIHGSILENRILLRAQPEYIQHLEGLVDPNKRKAWLEGDWDIAAGGFFDGIYNPDKQVIKPFKIPKHWWHVTSFDWGAHRPASLGIWAVAGGDKEGFPRGSLIRVDEWYAVERDKRGLTIPNKGLYLTNEELAKEIWDRIKPYKIRYSVADPSIWTEQGGPSIYAQMKRVRPDLRFRQADNARVPGWQAMVDMMMEATKNNPERPGLWIFDNCREWVRTIPTLMRDEKKFDDVDTRGEDHVADETRYICQSSKKVTTHKELLI